MFKRRSNASTTWPALTLTLAVALATTSAMAAVQGKDDKVDKGKEKDKVQQAEAVKKAPTPATPGSGVVLKPQSVDGTVSAYSAAVRKADPAAKVYTNADLEKIWAGDTAPWATSPSTAPAPDTAAAPTPPDSLAWLESESARAQDRARAIADAEAELAAANAAVSNLEKQMLNIRNPYAARAKLSEEEKAARTTDETVASRVARAEKQLADARERAATAQARLNQARRSN